MCIIAYKPAGVEMPDKKTIRAMFENNPDGAGIMFPYKNRVAIIKGLMTLNSVYDAINEISNKIYMKDVPVVMHFRIGTHGGLSQANTHPFPVTDHIPLLQKLRLKTDVAIAHNGIIHGTQYSKDLSDTMEYVRGQLAQFYKIDPEFHLDERFVKAIEYAIDSKMIIMDGEENIVMIGEFVEETDGMIYSNYTYIERTAKAYKWNGRSNYTSTKKIVKKHLAWLGDEDGYIRYKTGATVEASGFLIDQAGNVYRTMASGNVYKADYAEAFTHQGMPMKFDETFASDVDVEVWTYTYIDDDYTDTYEDYWKGELKKLDAPKSSATATAKGVK